MDEKLKSENVQKRAVFYVYVIFLRASVENGAMLTTYFVQIYFRMRHFVVKFSKILFASAGKGALTPLTKILRTFLAAGDFLCVKRG